MTRPLTPVCLVLMCSLGCGVESAEVQPIDDAAVSEASDVSGPEADTDAADPRESDAPDAEEPCDPIDDVGCGLLETCTFAGLDATEATCERAGPVALGEICHEDAGCAQGVCLALNGSVSVCHALCATDAGCPDAAACVAPEGVVFSVCEQWDAFPPCVLLDPESCPDDLSCTLVGGQTTPTCLAPGPGEPGEACDAADGCEASVACVEEVCRAICDPAESEPCAEAEHTCHPYYQGAGICGP